MSSRLPGFYKTPASKRQKIIAKHSDIGDYSIFKAESLPMEKADIMVENAIGTFALPLAVAVNFTINNKDILIPMVVEEPSVVAAVSNMARLLRNHGGFQASSDSSIMIGQIHIPNVEDVPSCLQALEKSKSRLTQHAQQLEVTIQYLDARLHALFPQ